MDDGAIEYYKFLAKTHECNIMNTDQYKDGFANLEEKSCDQLQWS